jgi:hypothetical protein
MRPTQYVTALSALCLAAPALAAPLVTSDSECPSADHVTARLAGLWSGDNPASATASIRVGLGRLTIDLISEGEPAVSRSLPAEPDCEARAQAAALVIAAWLDSRPGPLGEVESVPVPPLELASLRVPKPKVQPPLPVPPRLFLGIGALAFVDTRGAGAVLSPEAAWLRLVGRVGLWAGLWLPSPRKMTVDPGTARWWRPVLALGLRVPFTEGTWIAEGGIGPAFGLLVVSGSGFTQDHTDWAPSFGATVGFRLARLSRGRAYWAELRGLLWPAVQNIRSDVSGSVSHYEAVPRIEGQLGLGFSFSVF